MKSASLMWAAAPVILALAAPAAQANSAASASLSFNILAGSGFTWLDNPASSADSSASVAELTGFEFAAGLYSPVFGPAADDIDIATGVGIPTASASANAGTVFGSAFSFAVPVAANLGASALVPESGRAEATSFARSWFSLDAGASVTFQGSLLLSVTGSNPAFPANYSVGDFYSYASGLLAVGSDEVIAELGGPGTAGAVGSYSLNQLVPLSLSFTNTSGDVLTTYLDSGVSVYSVSAVPEPGSVALLLAGLSVVAFIARRKSAHR